MFWNWYASIVCRLELMLTWISRLWSRTLSLWRFKEVGSWASHFHCAGCYNFPSPNSILIPLVQTYCTCLTELNPGTKNVPAQILKGFCRDYILGRKVTLAKKFEIWTISQFLHRGRNRQYFFSWISISLTLFMILGLLILTADCSVYLILKQWF
jgi:hypothetical protein